MDTIKSSLKPQNEENGEIDDKGETMLDEDHIPIAIDNEEGVYPQDEEEENEQEIHPNNHKKDETLVDKLLASSINMTDLEIQEIEQHDTLQDENEYIDKKSKKKWNPLQKLREQLFPADVENIWGKSNILNIIRTILYCVSYLYMGLVLSVIGPALTTLRTATHATKEEMGYIFLTRGIGFIFGALIGGKFIEIALKIGASELRNTSISIDQVGSPQQVMHDDEEELEEYEGRESIEQTPQNRESIEQLTTRPTGRRVTRSIRLSQHIELRGTNFFRTSHQLRLEMIKHYIKIAIRNSHWMVALIHLILAVFNLLVPLVRELWLMLLVHIIVGFGAAYIDVWGNTVPTFIWKEKSNPWLQLLHFQFSIGATLAPFIVSMCFRFMSGSDQVALIVSYGVISLLGLLLVICYFIIPSPQIDLHKQSIHIIESKESHEVEDVQVDIEETTDTDSQITWRSKLRDKWMKIRSVTPRDVYNYLFKTFITDGGWIYISMAVMLGLYVGDEIAVGGLISSHVEDFGIMSKEDAALLAFAFWIALSGGRFIGIIVSLFLTPAAMLTINLFGSLASSIVVMIFPTNVYVIWICTILIGLFLASTFPTAIAFPTISGKAKMSGSLTSIMVVGASFGEMVIPVLASWLMVIFAERGLFVTISLIILAATVLLGITLILIYIKRLWLFFKDKKTNHEIME